MPIQKLSTILRLSPHDKHTNDLFETAFVKAVNDIVNARLEELDSMLARLVIDIESLDRRMDDLETKTGSL